jgi:plastocyanin
MSTAERPVTGFERAQWPNSPAPAMRRVSRASLFAFMLVVASICGRTATPAPAPASSGDTISIQNFSFSPVSLTVPVGATVHWKNLDGEPHTVRSVDEQFRSGALDQNDSFTFKFVKAGTYKYACSIHPQMVGTIVVK